MASVLTLALVLLCAHAHAQAQTPAASLADRLDAIARDAGGTVGLAAVHVESGRRVALRADQRFPMMSVYKLPIGLAVLKLVDEGKLSLDQRERFEAKDLRLGGVTAVESRFTPPSIDIPLRDLLEMMVSRSDNSACDRLLALAGGGAGVTARLREWGIDGIRVDRPEGQIAIDQIGFTPPPPEEWTLARLRAAASAAPDDVKRRGFASYLQDPRDTSTPDGMIRLLARVHRRDLVSAASADLLTRWLVDTPTTPKRMPAGVPPGATLAHKAGTSGDTPDGGTAVVNDVGIITLPNDGGHILIAIFVKGSPKPSAQVDPVIARLTRTVCDEWSGKASAAR